MALKIQVGGLFESRYLAIKSDHVEYFKTVILGSKHKFKFHEIDCILLSRENVLSFQVKSEVFSIPVKPENAKHKAVVDALLNEVTRAAASRGASSLG